MDKQGQGGSSKHDGKNQWILKQTVKWTVRTATEERLKNTSLATVSTVRPLKGPHAVKTQIYENMSWAGNESQNTE